MFKNNQKIQNRLDKIFFKIAEFDLDDGFDLALRIYEEVLAETIPRSSKYS